MAATVVTTLSLSVFIVVAAAAAAGVKCKNHFGEAKEKKNT